ncbi:MAG: translation initiation factor IF-2 N-terminal domain-containing protein [Nitrospinota bacterium]
MKKIRIYELAKKKKLTSKEVIKRLSKKGRKKLSAVSYVDPAALDGDIGGSGSTVAKGKVAQLFKNTQHGFSPPGAVRPVTSLAEKVVQPKAQPKPPSQPQTQKRTGKGQKQKTAAKASTASRAKGTSGTGLPLAAVGLSLAILLILGFLYTGMQADRTQIKAINTSLGQLNAKVAAIDESVITNRAQMLDMRGQMAAVSGQLNDLNKRFADSSRASLVAQLKTQSSVISVLAKNLDEPLKTRATGLANRLSSF